MRERDDISVFQGADDTGVDIAHGCGYSPASRKHTRTCAGRLDRRVNETFPATHGVEEELLRGEASQVRVLHKPTRLGAVIVLGEVRQRAVRGKGTEGGRE